MQITKLFTIALFGLFASTGLFAQSSGNGDVSEAKSRGNDPEITVPKKVNGMDSESKVAQPTDKGGRSRGSICRAYFDNYTSWYIDCYVDGSHEGYISPWGDGGVNVLGGATRIYAKAEFSDGSWKAWGPVTQTCNDQIFEMTIYPTFYNWSLE